MAIRFTNERAFNKRLQLFAIKTHIDFAQVVKKISIDIFAGIIRRTPVDTGIARASWLIGVSTEPSEQKRSATRNPLADISKLEQLRANPFTVVNIINRLPYIVRLEKGWSKQAPRGMVALAIAEEKAKMAGIVRLV